MDQSATPALRRRRLVLRLLPALLVAYVTVLSVQGVLAAQAAGRARTHQGDVVRTLSAADLPAARRAVDQLAADTARARAMLSGPQWALPEFVPLVGDDLRAVRVSVRALDDVVRLAGIPIVQAVSSLRGPNGRVDLAALPRLDPVLARAAQASALAQQHVGAIRPAGLLPPLRGPVVQAQDGVQRLSALTATARDGLRVAGAVTGAARPTTTLLGVQNPAEVRGSGGIVGAWATLRGRDGLVSITSTGVNDQLAAFRAAATLVPPDVLATYGQDVRHVANVTMTPNFPVAAQLLRSSYQAYARATPGATRLDDAAGVVTLTPRGLAMLIGATAPVQVDAHALTVTADNARALFENTIYTSIPDDRQRSLVVQQVLRDVFTSLRASATDPLRLAKAMASAAAGGDLRVWNPDATVQAAADGLGTSGALGSPDGDAAVFTLVSADAAKLDFYLYEQVVLDRRAGTLTVTLENRAPRDVAPYVAVHFAEPGESATGHDLILQLHLPPQVGVRRFDRDGRKVAMAAGREAGWTVVRAGVRVTRGSTTTVRYQLTGALEELTQVLTQPLSNPPTVRVL